MSRVEYQTPECVLHNQAYQFYCQSCEEPICKQCTLIGPHNNQLHLCSHINQSYRNKVAEITGMMNQLLPTKRQLLLCHMSRLEYALEEVKVVRQSISKHTKQNSLGMLNRLETVCDQKCLYLRSLIQNIQIDLNAINDIGHRFQNMVKESNQDRMVQTLSRYKTIGAEMQRLTAKRCNEDILVTPDQLPRELSLIRWGLNKISSYDQINNTKREAILKVLQKRLEEERRTDIRLQKEFQGDIRSWRKQTEYNLCSLESNLLVCHFCGVYLDSKVVNLECEQNSMVTTGFKGYCAKLPNHEYLSTRRHYFGQPTVLNLRNPNEVVGMYLRVLVSQLKISALNSGVDIHKMVRQHDPKGSGYIKQLNLLYIVSQKCRLDQKTARTIISSLQSQANGVLYNPLLKMISE